MFCGSYQLLPNSITVVASEPSLFFRSSVQCVKHRSVFCALVHSSLCSLKEAVYPLHSVRQCKNFNGSLAWCTLSSLRSCCIEFILRWEEGKMLKDSCGTMTDAGYRGGNSRSQDPVKFPKKHLWQQWLKWGGGAVPGVELLFGSVHWAKYWRLGK